MLLAILGLVFVVAIVGIIGFFTLGKQKDIIQGEVEVEEFRVACKYPGRVVELRVKEGDYVHVGDTLAIIEIPEMDAQKKVAQATTATTEAIKDLTDAGARKEQIQGAFELLQQARAAAEITKKTYNRLQNLYNEGVFSAQKRDEAFAAFKASEAQVKAAESQYNMAKNGARSQEKRVADSNVKAALGAVEVVSSMLKETVQVAQVEGEVSEVYPKVGELLGLGSPIMSISELSDQWGTFNIREDQLKGMKIGTTFSVFVPAFNKEMRMKVYYVKDQGSYAVWKATKTTGQYDLKTFEVRARPLTKMEGLRPGMSLILK